MKRELFCFEKPQLLQVTAGSLSAEEHSQTAAELLARSLVLRGKEEESREQLHE